MEIPEGRHCLNCKHCKVRIPISWASSLGRFMWENAYIYCSKEYWPSRKKIKFVVKMNGKPLPWERRLQMVDVFHLGQDCEDFEEA